MWARKNRRHDLVRGIEELAPEPSDPANVAANRANIGVTAALTGWALIVLSTARNTHALGVAVSDQRFIPFYLAGTTVMVLLTIYASSSRRERRDKWQLP